MRMHIPFCSLSCDAMIVPRYKHRHLYEIKRELTVGLFVVMMNVAWHQIPDHLELLDYIRIPKLRLQIYDSEVDGVAAGGDSLARKYWMRRTGEADRAQRVLVLGGGRLCRRCCVFRWNNE